MRQIPDRGPGAVLGYAFALVVIFLFFVTTLGIYLEWDKPLLLGLVIGGAVGVVVAVWLVLGYNQFLWKVEEMSSGRLELTGDEWTGQPPQEAEPGNAVRPVPVFAPQRPIQSANPETAGLKASMWVAPSGGQVSWPVLEWFAHMAPSVGTTYQGYWKEALTRHGFENPHDKWQDIMDIWYIVGCVEKRRERHTAEWYPKTHEEAMQRLGTVWANRPTP